MTLPRCALIPLAFAAFQCAARAPVAGETGAQKGTAPPVTVSSSPSAAASSVAAPAASAAPVPAPPAKLQVAERIQITKATQARFAPLRASRVVLGERWGCAVFGTAVGATSQCWEAPPPGSSGPAQAWDVPWLRDKREILAGPDRLCQFERPDHLTFRCWQPPKRGVSSGVEFPASHEWLNPNGAKWGEAFERSDRVDTIELGGTFACLKATKDGSVWCVGDDHFGQLGGSSLVPPPTASPEDPAFVQGIWPAEQVVVGTWHACAMAAPRGLAMGGHIACWGRGDGGQLGAPATDQCAVGSASVACAKTPLAGVKFKLPVMALSAGDMYTCMSTPEGTSCWGASRDGFFGKPAECPPTLRRAWPTLHGSVAAPRAACSAKPVKVPAIKGFQQWMQVGPRGLCFHEDEAKQWKCLGGIRTPRPKGVTGVVVSPGADAAACGLLNGQVVCWGEGYSKPGTPDVPVTISLGPPPPVSEIAVVASRPPEAFEESCQIRRGCEFGPAPLPRCTPDTHPVEWSQLLPSAAREEGKTVSVRGPLGVGSMFSTLVACSGHKGLEACCNQRGGLLVLGGAATLKLSRFFCTGDESEVCCNAPAYGQTVVASGRLERDDRPSTNGESGYVLTETTLCAEP